MSMINVLPMVMWARMMGLMPNKPLGVEAPEKETPAVEPEDKKPAPKPKRKK